MLGPSHGNSDYYLKIRINNHTKYQLFPEDLYGSRDYDYLRDRSPYAPCVFFCMVACAPAIEYTEPEDPLYKRRDARHCEPPVPHIASHRLGSWISKR